MDSVIASLVRLRDSFLPEFAILIILLVCAWLGNPLLALLGITVPMLQAAGGLILFDDRAVHVAVPLVLAVTAMTVAFFLLVIGFAVRARRAPRVTGAQAMLGRRALVVDGLGPRGRVRLDGELWNAEALGNIEVGAEVVVIGVEGLTLRVRPAAREA